MADEQELTLQTLVTKFKFDRDSARATLDDQAAAQREQSQLADDLRDLERQKLNIGLEAARQKKLQDLQETEEQLKRHYARLYEEHGVGNERRLELERKFQADMANIQRQRAMAEGGAPEVDSEGRPMDNLGVGRITGALHKLDGAMKNILPGIGLGFLSAALTVGGLVANLNAAFDRMRQIDSASRSIAAGAGQYGTGFMPALSVEIQDIQRHTGRKPEDIARTASIFTPIMGAGGSGGAQAGDLAREAIGLGSYYGISENTVAQTMVKLRQLDDIPTEKLGARFNDLAQAAMAAGRPVAEYSSDVVALTEQTKKYGIGLQDNMRLVSLFSRELQDGVVTIADLSRLKTGFASAGEGERAWAMTEMLQNNLVSGEVMRRMQAVANNPAALQMLGRRIIQEGGPQADELNKGVHLLAQQRADAMFGNLPEAQRNEMVPWVEEKLREMMGVLSNPSIEAAEKLKEAALLQKEASRGTMDANTAVVEANTAIKLGIDMLLQQLSPQDKLKLGISGFFEDFGLGLSAGLGDKGSADKMAARQAMKFRQALQAAGPSLRGAGAADRNRILGDLFDTGSSSLSGFTEVMTELGHPEVASGVPEMMDIQSRLNSPMLSKMERQKYEAQYENLMAAMRGRFETLIIENRANDTVDVRAPGAREGETPGAVERQPLPQGSH